MVIPIEHIKQRAKMRPSGYVEDVLASGKVVGNDLHLTKDTWQALSQKYQSASQPSVWPLWAKAIKSMAIEADKGVGDTVARVFGVVGGGQFKEWFKKSFGRSCGCSERQESLNKQYQYALTLTKQCEPAQADDQSPKQYAR